MTTVAEIRRELERLVEATGAAGEDPPLRTSVMTHIAWVPEPWRASALAVLAGLGEAHPSRTILLFPRPELEDGLEAEVDLRCFVEGRGQQVCSEVVSIELRGRLATAPASVALPLLRSDLPVFLRWRGALVHGSPELEQLVELADRLVVDAREWDDLDAGYGDLARLFDRISVSDIAWARTEPWRSAIAGLWPDVASVERLHVSGPAAEARLLSGWLSARLGRSVALDVVPGEELEGVEVDGVAVVPVRQRSRSPSDLLSAQLELFGRDPVYEQAVTGFMRPAASPASR